MTVQNENRLTLAAFALISAAVFAIWWTHVPRPPENLTDLVDGLKCDLTLMPCSTEAHQRYLAYQKAIRDGWVKDRPWLP